MAERRRVAGCIAAVLVIGALSACGAAENDSAEVVGTTAEVAGTTLADESGLPMWCDEVPEPGAIKQTEPAVSEPDYVLVGVLQRYADEHPDTFGGLWLDPDHGGTVVIAFTDDPGPHREAIAALTGLPGDPAGYPKPEGYETPSTAVAASTVVVDVHQVPHRWQDVVDLLPVVQSTLMASDVEVGVIGGSVQLNRAMIGLVEPDDAARRTIADLLPSAIEMVCINRDAQQPPTALADGAATTGRAVEDPG